VYRTWQFLRSPHLHPLKASYTLFEIRFNFFCGYNIPLWFNGVKHESKQRFLVFSSVYLPSRVGAPRPKNWCWIIIMTDNSFSSQPRGQELLWEPPMLISGYKRPCPTGKRPASLKLTTKNHLAPMLEMRGIIPPLIPVFSMPWA